MGWGSVEGGGLKSGIEIIPFGDIADPRLIADLEREAEAAGWGALSLCDHVGFPFGVADPWVALAAVAAITSQIRHWPRKAHGGGKPPRSFWPGGGPGSRPGSELVMLEGADEARNAERELKR